MCRRSWYASSLIGFAVGAQSPALPTGNTADNWWLKLTWGLRGHEISFNPSPNSAIPPSTCSWGPLRKRHTYTAVNHLAWHMLYPPRSRGIALECCYWFGAAELQRGKGIECELSEDVGFFKDGKVMAAQIERWAQKGAVWLPWGT